MKRVAVVAGLAGVFLTTGAMAGWQDAKWGMSAGEVAAVTGAADTTGTPSEGPIAEKLKMPFAASTSSIGSSTVYFGFDHDDRLQRVRLVPDDPDACSSVEFDLFLTYGPTGSPGTPGGPPQIHSWRDTVAGNLVTYILMSENSCKVTYEPLPRAGVNGSL